MGFDEDQLALNDMSSSKTIMMLHNVVAKFHNGNEILILANSVYIARRRTRTLVVTSLTTDWTTKKV